MAEVDAVFTDDVGKREIRRVPDQLPRTWVVRLPLPIPPTVSVSHLQVLERIRVRCALFEYAGIDRGGVPHYPWKETVDA